MAPFIHQLEKFHMKIRIIEPGWEKFTGELGPIVFVDGVSVDHVSQREAFRIAGSIRCEDVDTGKNPSITQQMVDMNAAEAPNLSLPMDPVEDPVDTSEEPVDGEDTSEKTEVLAPPPSKYTRAQLEALADTDGIKGLRAVAEPLGAKSSSIQGLIEDILLKQGE